MKRVRIHASLVVFMFLLALTVDESVAQDDLQKDDGAVPVAIGAANTIQPIYLLDTAKYKKDGNLSESAQAECNLEKGVTNAVVEFGAKYNMPIQLVQTENELAGKDAVLTLRIDNIVAGRGSHGFGGRWVVSDLGVTASYAVPGIPEKTTYAKCSAGLGANPFANFKACERLDRCTTQIGKKISAWLKQELTKTAPQVD